MALDKNGRKLLFNMDIANYVGNAAEGTYIW
jgi:hypothetical protein